MLASACECGRVRVNVGECMRVGEDVWVWARARGCVRGRVSVG